MLNVNLTDGEVVFFRRVLEVCGNGYKTKEEALYLKGDNYSWFDGADLIQFGYSKEQVGGFMASLRVKGLIGTERNDNAWVTDEGVQVALEQLYNEESQPQVGGDEVKMENANKKVVIEKSAGQWKVAMYEGEKLVKWEHCQTREAARAKKAKWQAGEIEKTRQAFATGDTASAHFVELWVGGMEVKDIAKATGRRYQFVRSVIEKAKERGIVRNPIEAKSDEELAAE